MKYQKWETPKNDDWYKVGVLPSGEAVYCNQNGEHAKECDHSYLVEMSEAELKSMIPD